MKSVGGAGIQYYKIRDVHSMPIIVFNLLSSYAFYEYSLFFHKSYCWKSTEINNSMLNPTEPGVNRSNYNMLKNNNYRIKRF